MKVRKPLVSIIVPIYNTDAYLDRCVQSIVAQTLQNWELILVDDGSTDRSPQLCDGYASNDSTYFSLLKRSSPKHQPSE